MIPQLAAVAAADLGCFIYGNIDGCVSDTSLTPVLFAVQYRALINNKKTNNKKGRQTEIYRKIINSVAFILKLV